MKESEFQKLERQAENIERVFGSLENFAISKSKTKDEHKMKMESDAFDDELLSAYDDLSDLDIADLVDYMNLGRFDGEHS